MKPTNLTNVIKQLRRCTTILIKTTESHMVNCAYLGVGADECIEKLMVLFGEDFGLTKEQFLKLWAIAQETAKKQRSIKTE